MARKKMATSAEMLCRLSQPAFREFTDSVMNAKFEDEPNYARYIAMFEPLVNVPERPLVVDNALKVSRGGVGQWMGPTAAAVVFQEGRVKGCTTKSEHRSH